MSINSLIKYELPLIITYYVIAVCTVLLTKEINLDLFYLKFRNLQYIYKRYLFIKIIFRFITLYLTENLR